MWGDSQEGDVQIKLVQIHIHINVRETRCDCVLDGEHEGSKQCVY